ncbi:MAG: serine/threonine protein kinase [Myxococcales bacterium]|nr:serine/threonine protein kinase [Myxococcales bacterium]
MAHDTTDAHDGLIGAVLDERYELTSVVGRGGMGIVYGALDRKLSGRPCAIKLLTGHAGDPEENRRFERELDHIARLRSRHVVQVLDAGQLPDKRRFIVMELLEGNTLAALLKREGPLSAERAIPLARGVLAGLAEAHDNGIVHRDLKPANVFIVQTRTGEEIAKILDFGIAKETSTDVEDLTGRSMLIGTPKYMAPEQFKKQRADGRTDLYAAGLLLYEMLSGAPPFTPHTRVPASIEQMPDEFRIGWLHVNQAPPPLRGFDAVWPVIERLLAKKPERRYEDANAVIEALGQLGKRTGPPAPRIAGEPSQPGLTSMASTTGFPVLGETLDLPAHRPRRPLVRALVGLALLALVSGGAWFALNEDSSAARSARTAARNSSSGSRLSRKASQRRISALCSSTGAPSTSLKGPSGRSAMSHSSRCSVSKSAKNQASPDQ